MDFKCGEYTYVKGDAQFGSAPDSITKPSGQVIAISNNTGNLELRGYIFDGWFDKTTNIRYNPGYQLTVTKSMTLYPIWKNNQFKITYYGNGNTGGKAPDASPFIGGERAQIKSKGDLVKNQHKFVGWNTKSDGSGTTYPALAEVTLYGNLSLYAMWRKDAALELFGISENAIKVVVAFPESGVYGNKLELYDAFGNSRPFDQTSEYTADGSYLITGLQAVTNYTCKLSWAEGSIELPVKTFSELAHYPEEPFSQEAFDEYVTNGGIVHTEVIYDDSTEVYGITPYWGTKGTYNSHKKIVEQAGVILYNDTQNSNGIDKRVYDRITETIEGKTGLEIAIEYSTKPDEDEMDWGFAYHFYGSDKNNFLPAGIRDMYNAKQTALTKFSNHYNGAVTAYKNGNKHLAYEELGRAIHYLSDINAPHHAANAVAILTYHMDYEAWVAEHLMDYLVDSALSEGSYNYVRYGEFENMADAWAEKARAQMVNADAHYIIWANNEPVYLWDSTNAGIATAECFTRAQRAAAGLLYRFAIETGVYRSVPNAQPMSISEYVD